MEGKLDKVIRSDLFRRYEKLRPLVLPFSTELLGPMEQFVTEMAAQFAPQVDMRDLLRNGSKAHHKDAKSRQNSYHARPDLTALIHRALFARAAFELLHQPGSRADPMFARREANLKLSTAKAKKLKQSVYDILHDFRGDILGFL